MSRESVEAKGRRYLLESRLVVEHVDRAVVRARCRGGGTTYELGFGDVGGGDFGWYCTCPAHTRCAHLVALQLVTGRPPEPRRRPVHREALA